MAVIGGPGRFRRKPTVRTVHGKGTLRIPKIEFELLAVVFWCWLRNKQLNINAPMRFEVEVNQGERKK